MERDGYESDENRLMVQNLKTGEKRFLTQGIETNVDAYYWKDSTHLVYSAVWHGTAMLYQVNLEGERECLTTGQYDFVPGGNIGNTYYCLRHSMREANEIFCFTYDEKLEKEKDMTNLSDSAKLAEAFKQSMMNPNGEIVQLTFENVNIYTQIERGKVVARWQKTSDGQDMLTWIIYPPHFDSTKKYPTLLYCEGGPQSPVSQFWSYRWNFMMMAANDYIIVAPNRRGLPGFGNAWNEQISGDYGGQCMRDYLAAIDEFAANESYVDRDRLGCVGASFGGFSVYWLAGHHDKRFKAFIAHDGIFNMQMQYLETEEKWFANWDMGGAYWDKQNAIAQRTFANSPHLFVDKWDTPILCIHGEKDYRILANQSMAAFDAAKMRGVEAQLLIFPDENHWVLKPQNGILWQRTFAEWLDKWLK
jgi:dipeptidyl aminopeptidase/acylaminoacyl peptidase